ncbi:hypothetical protein A2291_00555 [candidate division WOR-1 bacterium RIFOXYB2_FULL_42_35]|uniref:Ribbon-helix-helix protein CopG domain-containing protein n=1 Tax=candidate division WOR-1 bacterium RIFOXYC2_FULL_41_25 TaxID=1802586 RepID=A0A1F4TJT4_UNCSA|nr:MAG: hypothetical protein A2247_06830 [candidate division WOR-1 bacterium RIFOXYA2_FULL_41_14]OGC23462.1 MAG: hypothetical protein A2291_00555 [candidate division WOR-1 bacterium RIFOXYB2_FULL_42_35]OGC32985.1 MAG: hypothetical protein A2462_03600 [candidate division WOR-1 bacterium RIFOXYC2_FULL_41_25]OGC44108.1 MAG: hypothetical protein A2548_06550 [candidate division WOR-1 bacterium RIFOXYD2_FULL_41_8]
MTNRRILTLSLPQSLQKEIGEVAKEEKVSVSELFRLAIRDFIGRMKWDKAAKYGQRVAREMKITEDDIEGIVHEFRKK